MQNSPYHTGWGWLPARLRMEILGGSSSEDYCRQRTTLETFLPSQNAKTESGFTALVGCKQVRGPPLVLSWKCHCQRGDSSMVCQGLPWLSLKTGHYHHLDFSDQGDKAQIKEMKHWNEWTKTTQQLKQHLKISALPSYICTLHFRPHFERFASSP